MAGRDTTPRPLDPMRHAMSLRHGYLRPPRRQWPPRPHRPRAVVSTEAGKRVGMPLLMLALSLFLMTVTAVLVLVAYAVAQ